MRFKRFIYSILLILFTLVLLGDLGLWFLVPDAENAAEGDTDVSFTPPAGMTFPTEGGCLPEGVSLPEGMTLPEGGSFLEGMTLPEGSSFPSGMTFPGAGEGEESAFPRRPDRTGSDSDTAAAEAAETAEAETSPLKAWLSAKVDQLRQYLPLSALTPIKETVEPYRLYILMGAALGMVLCIVRLIFLGKKLRQQQAEQEAAGSLRRVALWPAFLLLLAAFILVVFLFPATEEEAAEDGAVAEVRIVSGTVEEKALVSRIQSTGSLAEQEAVSVEIPASVKISSVCVRNGELVTAGQIVAKVDETSVMQAAASVHEALADIDGQLQKAHEAKADVSLTAPVAATVKAVYAQVGEKAMDVMQEHGALMLLSLDGRMAVQVPASEGLTVASTVTVTLSDGTELAGEVTFLEEGMATVTVADRGYAVGAQVSVKTEDGVLLGDGPLYVHKALHITGYLGTLARIYRSEGSTVYAGAAVIGLTDTADLAEYDALLKQRAEYEAELKTLFEIYEDGYIHAPCKGAIDGLSEELTYASLSDMMTGLTVRHVATGPADAEPEEYVHYVGEVLENAGGLLYLKVGANPVTVSSYTALPSLPAATMEGTYAIPGSAPIYLSGGGWNPVTVNDILPGDRLLFTFDANGSLVWVILAHTSNSATPTPTPSPTPAPTPTPTPDGSAQPADSSSQPGEGPSPSESPGTDGPSGSGRTGGGISIRVPSGNGGGNSGSGAKKAAYTIAEQELCTVTPQEKMLISVPVDELDVLSLALGQEAELYLDALPSQVLTATVTDIDPEGENSGGNTKYTVTLALDRLSQLYPGMNGTVCFPRSGGEPVPTVALAAVAEQGDKTVVYTSYDQETKTLGSPVEVQTGLSDGTDVEIRSGLAPGDAYYYEYADTISYVTE